MVDLPNKDKLIYNFSRCSNWEEKYLYIIELGELLPPLPDYMRTTDHLISGCQSQVWIVLTIDKCGIVQLYGDSDAAIVKGLIALIFILYRNMTPEEVIDFDVRPFFNTLALAQYLTPSRSEGLEAMIKIIQTQAARTLIK